MPPRWQSGLLRHFAPRNDAFEASAQSTSGFQTIHATELTLRCSVASARTRRESDSAATPASAVRRVIIGRLGSRSFRSCGAASIVSVRRKFDFGSAR